MPFSQYVWPRFKGRCSVNFSILIDSVKFDEWEGFCLPIALSSKESHLLRSCFLSFMSLWRLIVCWNLFKKIGPTGLNEGFLTFVISRILFWQNFLMFVFHEIRMNCKQELHFPSQNLMMIFTLYELSVEIFWKAIQAYLRSFQYTVFKCRSKLSKNLWWWWLWDTTLLLLIASVH